MTSPPVHGSAGFFRAASNRAFSRALAAAVVLCAGTAAVYGLERALNAVFDKPPAPLQKSLDRMSKELRAADGRKSYAATKPDEVLDHETEASLGTPNYLLREYLDLSRPADAPDRMVKLNLNYYATGSSTPHVPEICWAGSGLIERKELRGTFEVPGVRSRDGTLRTLKVRMLSFTPDKHDLAVLKALGREPTDDLYTNVAYVFQVNGEYVSTPEEVSSQFWKAAHRYAYHAKIEVTPMVVVPKELLPEQSQGEETTRPMCTTRREAEQIVARFLTDAVPAAEECLPDPAILTAPAAAPTQTPQSR